MVDSFECCELAACILGIEEYEDEEDVWEQMYEEHDIEKDAFCWLINKLVPMIAIGESLLGKTINLGFSKKLGNGISELLVKRELKNPEVFKENIAIGWIFQKMTDRERGLKSNSLDQKES